MLLLSFIIAIKKHHTFELKYKFTEIYGDDIIRLS